MAKWGLFKNNCITKLARTDTIKEDIKSVLSLDTFVEKQLTDEEFLKLQKELIHVTLDNNGNMVWGEEAVEQDFIDSPRIVTEKDLNKKIDQWKVACKYALKARPNGELAPIVKSFQDQLDLIIIETPNYNFGSEPDAEAQARQNFNFITLPLSGKSFEEWMFSQTNVPTLGLLELY